MSWHYSVYTGTLHLGLPFRHLAINVATAVEPWRHLRENCSVKSHLKIAYVAKSDIIYDFVVVNNKEQTQKADAQRSRIGNM